MAADLSFLELIQCVRAGGQLASADFVKQHKPALRVRLRDARLRRLIDSTDVCQSVMDNFFVRPSAGAFKLQTPEQLIRLLLTLGAGPDALRLQMSCAVDRIKRGLQSGP
jgi:RNA polymerase sigma-70 factor (ECF subfamily)